MQPKRGDVATTCYTNPEGDARGWMPDQAWHVECALIYFHRSREWLSYGSLSRASTRQKTYSKNKCLWVSTRRRFSIPENVSEGSFLNLVHHYLAFIIWHSARPAQGFAIAQWNKPHHLALFACSRKRHAPPSTPSVAEPSTKRGRIVGA